MQEWEGAGPPPLLLLRAESLCPVDIALVRKVREVRETHLLVLRAHDVRAMTGAVDPALHDGFRARRTKGDVLAHRLPVVASAQHPIRGHAAVRAAMLEQLVGAHVFRMRECSARQERGELERRHWRKRA